MRIQRRRINCSVDLYSGIFKPVQMLRRSPKPYAHVPETLGQAHAFECGRRSEGWTSSREAQTLSKAGGLVFSAAGFNSGPEQVMFITTDAELVDTFMST